MACKTAITLPPTPSTPPAPGTSASPGFTWSRFGATNTGTYLLNDSVPSNVAGRKLPFTGLITRIFVTSQNDDTFDVSVMLRTGVNTFSTLVTVSLLAQRANVFSGLTTNVSQNDELAVMISSGSCSNAEIGVIIEQT